MGRTTEKHASRAEIQQSIQNIIFLNSDSFEPHERLEIAKDQFKTVEKLIREDPNNPDRQSVLLMPLILLMKGLEHSDPEKEKYAQRSIELLRFLTVFEITHSASSLAQELSLARSILEFHFARQEFEEVVALGREWDLILFGPSGFGPRETNGMRCCMLIGLASFSVDDFELAVKYFEAAADRAAIQDDPDFLKLKGAVAGLLLCYDRIGQAEKVEEIKNKYPEILGPDGMHLDDD